MQGRICGARCGASSSLGIPPRTAPRQEQCPRDRANICRPEGRAQHPVGTLPVQRCSYGGVGYRPPCRDRHMLDHASTPQTDTSRIPLPKLVTQVGVGTPKGSALCAASSMACKGQRHQLGGRVCVNGAMQRTQSACVGKEPAHRHAATKMCPRAEADRRPSASNMFTEWRCERGNVPDSSPSSSSMRPRA